MRAADLFGQTLRDAPADAQVPSHRLLLRGAFVRQVSAGIYAWLPLGLRVLRRVEGIVREEMDAAGAVEILMPLLQPADPWHRTGRVEAYGPVLYRLTDRSEREFCLGPTHEPIVTLLAATELASYRDLPSIPYQVQWKFRDEPRARGGLLRGREFLMKDAYSFDADEAGLAASYDRMRRAYDRAFARLALQAVRVLAQPGSIGGSGRNEEYLQPSASGEDTFVRCASCGYAANTEAAVARTDLPYRFGDGPVEKVHTPGRVTVAEVASFLGVEERQLAKALLFRAAEGIVCALVPGDRELNEHKLAGLVGDARMLTDEEFASSGLVKGFAGPVGLAGVRLIADESLRTATGLVTGANEHDHHLVGVAPGRDFTPDVWAELVLVSEGDGCPSCDGTLAVERGIEVAHIFELGTFYSAQLDATFTDDAGSRRPFVMGCYGLGISRAVAAIVDAHHDERGIRWPRAVAPADVVILLLSGVDAAVAAARSLETDLSGLGLAGVLDDRPVSAGVKFADADLIGYPLQVVVGKGFLTSGRFETKVRATGSRSDAVSADEVAAALEGCP